MKFQMESQQENEERILKNEEKILQLQKEIKERILKTEEKQRFVLEWLKQQEALFKKSK